MKENISLSEQHGYHRSLEIAKKKAQRTGKKRKKNQNWGVKTRDHESNAKRPWGGEVDGYHRLLER